MEGGRETILLVEDEEAVRRTLKQINEKILEFRTQFAGKDMQDYVAMVLLWFVTEQTEGQTHPELAHISERLTHLESLLDQPFAG